MNITNAGVGSGLDLEGIIEAYVTARSVPTEVRLQEKEDRLKTELSGVGQLRSAISNFESTLKKLDKTTDFAKQSITTSSSDIDVTTNGFASSGSFQVEVQKLAFGTRSESALFGSSSDTTATGNLTFTVGADSFNVAIDATDSLSAIRDKINEASDNFGVTANVITTDAGTFLSYTSDKTGTGNDLVITNDNAGSLLDNISTGVTVKQTAQDAEILLDGNLISSDTNEFKNKIEDVTINVKTANIGNPTTLTIEQDIDNGRTVVQDFMNSYNALVDTVSSLGNAETGALAFDPALRSIKSQMINIVTGSVSGLTGSIDSLDDIGVVLNKDGKLELSTISIGGQTGSQKLDQALENDLDEVGELFASTNGVTAQLNTLLDSYNGNDGSLTERNSSLSAEIKGIADEWAEHEARLRDYEDTLRKQFTFLDGTVAQYNATSSWLTANLTSATVQKKD